MHLKARLNALAVKLARPFLSGVLAVLRVTQPPLARWLGTLRVRSGRLRSVWAVTPILTLPLLARADRLLGLRSESMVYTTYYITRDFDRDLSLSHAWIVDNVPGLYALYCEVVFLLALPRYDVFHYFHDRGFMAPAARYGIHPRELDYLRRTGRRLYTYAYGADVRERDSTLRFGEWNFCRECDDPGRYCICRPGELAQSLAPVRLVARAMNAMGDMLPYVPRVNHLHYWPVDLDKIPARRQDRRRVAGDPLVLAHAPNHGHFKGTKYVLAAVETLKAEGHAIELQLVQGVPNTQVLELFAKADVVLDQLVGGFHGYTALEAMALGKPVITYVRSEDLVLPGCPLINATPDTIVQVLRDLCEGRYDLAQLGRRGEAYVREHYSVASVADRLGDLYLRTGGLPGRARDRIEHARSRLRSAEASGAARREVIA
jgi:glycosyltransferase involved in cell wall biosynthesis